jgi:serine/threonine protein kinase
MQSYIFLGKGEFIGSGTTSVVELLPSGDVMKSPLPGPREAECRAEMEIESCVYSRLGKSPHLVKLRSWDPQACTLTLEFMPNGTLKEFLKTHYEDIPWSQKLRWMSDAAAAIHLLHSANVVHCDVGPHNFLLDADLKLRIADFGGSSIDSSRAMVCPGVRYSAPHLNKKDERSPSVGEDIFALGSTIYYIMTGQAPFEEIDDEEVMERFEAGHFPDLIGVPCADVISLCWQQNVSGLTACMAPSMHGCSGIGHRHSIGLTIFLVVLCSSVWLVYSAI